MEAQNASFFLAMQRNAASGRSAFAYPEYETGGEVFQYEHRGYGDRCLLHAISLKMDRNCGDTVLLQLDIHYESLGSDGGIGWMFAVNTFSVKARKFLWSRIERSVGFIHYLSM
mmetsp:Transcript_25745/g.36909  ORF Transcript_25745/g.36909 Transcript_25745/m.36909 type:complete len:114 (-) Transcript_25745:797-1138(-)